MRQSVRVLEFICLSCFAFQAAAGYPQSVNESNSPPAAGEISPTSAQNTAISSFVVPPTASDPQTSQSGQSDGTVQKPIQQNPQNGPPPQTKRILEIIPNFRSVSTDEKLPPMSVKEKFLTATDDSFDYSSIFIPAALAGYSMGTKSTPEFGQGAVGYGRYFWHAAVDQTSENYMVEFVFPVITREDNRYYTLGRGGFFKRTGYALSRAVVTRNDSSKETFNISEVVGAGASAGLSSLYYPTRERSLGNTGTEWAVDIGIDAASFVVKEFWPEINRRLFHRNDAIAGASQSPAPAR